MNNQKGIIVRRTYVRFKEGVAGGTAKKNQNCWCYVNIWIWRLKCNAEIWNPLRYCYTFVFVCLFVCLMVFNATFNNISAISWRSVLLVEETEGLGENHRPVASHWQSLSLNVVYLALIEIRTHNISGDMPWLHR